MIKTTGILVEEYKSPKSKNENWTTGKGKETYPNHSWTV